MTENGTFQATEILAKHDENYMPKEVIDALKEQGIYVAPPVELSPGRRPEPPANPLLGGSRTIGSGASRLHRSSSRKIASPGVPATLVRAGTEQACGPLKRS